MSGKSPVNVIQEYCVKKGLVPNYQMIVKQGGTHVNVFVCIATCGNLRGEGTGSSKKEAKKLSAERLIEQIPELILTKKFDEILTVQQPPKRVLDLEVEQSKLSSLPSSNYINFLAEWCIKRNVSSPEYVTNDIGSIRLPHFETECKILSHSCKGKGDTKKASKHEAAKRMYCLITETSCTESDPNTDLEKFGIDIKKVEIDTYPDEKVHEEYKRLSSNCRYSRTNNHKTIANCHNDLKECYNECERNVVCKMLQNLISCNAEGDRASVRKKFENILERLNVEVTYRDLSSLIDRKKCQDKSYIASVGVSTKPELIEIFCAETYTFAQHQAVINLSKTLVQILY